MLKSDGRHAKVKMCENVTYVMISKLPKKALELLGEDVKERKTEVTRDKNLGFTHSRVTEEDKARISKIERETGLTFVGEGKDTVVWKRGNRVLRVADPEHFPPEKVLEILFTHKILYRIFPDHFIAPSRSAVTKDISLMDFPFQEGEDFHVSAPRNIHREMMYKFFRESGLLHPVNIDYVGKGNIKITEGGQLVYVDCVYDLIMSREDKIKIISYLLGKNFSERVLGEVSEYCDRILDLKNKKD